MWGRDERDNRRHAWSAVDTREAVCTRCDARTRVSLVVTPAGVRAAIARHGPERCPGRKPWWRTNYWYGTTQAEPARPWADDEIAPSSSTGGPDRHEHQANASDRTDAAAIDEGGPVRHEHQAWADNTRDVFVWLPLASWDGLSGSARAELRAELRADLGGERVHWAPEWWFAAPYVRTMVSETTAAYLVDVGERMALPISVGPRPGEFAAAASDRTDASGAGDWADRTDAEGDDEIKPSSSKPSKPSSSKPSKPSSSKPSKPSSSKAKPSKAKPSKAKPSKAKPSKAKPSKAKPSKRVRSCVGRVHARRART